MRRYGCSESTCSGGSSPGCASRSKGASTTCSTLGDSRIASSRIGSIGTVLPRRDDSCCVITTFASLACRRCATAGAAKPEKIGTWIAPMCAIACEATATSGDIGRKMPTRSPGSTPSETSCSASRVTSRESSANVTSRRAPSSASPTAAMPSGRDTAQRCTQLCAMFRVAPTNQVVHAGPRESSSTCVQGCENSSPRSSTASGQNQAGSSCERRTSSPKSATPARRTRRVAFACSTVARSGRQTTSLTAVIQSPTTRAGTDASRM